MLFIFHLHHYPNTNQLDGEYDVDDEEDDELLFMTVSFEDPFMLSKLSTRASKSILSNALSSNVVCKVLFNIFRVVFFEHLKSI